MAHTIREIDSIVAPSGHALDLEAKTLPTGMTMGGSPVATTANIVTSFVLGDAPDGVTVGADKFVYLDSADGKVKEALSTDIDVGEQVYFTVAGSLANGFPVSVVTETYQVFGVTFETGQTPTAGEPLYLSASEAGNVTHTAPDDGVLVGELVSTTGNKFAARLAPQIGKNAIGTDNLQDDGVTEVKLAAAVRSKLNSNNDPASKPYKATITDASGVTTEMIAAADLATGNELWDVRYIVTEAFDQASTLTLGVSGDVDAVATIDLTATLNELQKINSRYVMTASEAVNLTFTANSATTGSVTVYVERKKF